LSLSISDSCREVSHVILAKVARQDAQRLAALLGTPVAGIRSLTVYKGAANSFFYAHQVLPHHVAIHEDLKQLDQKIARLLITMRLFTHI